jgi:hypothetical protein
MAANFEISGPCCASLRSQHTTQSLVIRSVRLVPDHFGVTEKALCVRPSLAINRLRP